MEAAFSQPVLRQALISVGGLAMMSGATLSVELGGTIGGSQYDQVLSSGAFSLNGALNVSLINGFTPSAGQSFNILDWGSLAGTFSSLNLPTLSGASWNTSQLYVNGVLSVALPGDFNNDGTVDAADYVVWRKTDGSRRPATTHGEPTSANPAAAAQSPVQMPPFPNRQPWCC